MVKKINNITGEEIEISMEEFLSEINSAEISLTDIQQVINIDDEPPIVNQIYGINMSDDSKMDLSINLFGKMGELYTPATSKAKKVANKNENDDNFFRMDNSIVDYIVMVDVVDMPAMYRVAFTKDSVKIAHYVRDEQRSIIDPMIEKEFSYVDGMILADIDEVKEDPLLLMCFSVHETINLIKERNILQVLKDNENKGTGVIISTLIGEDDDVEIVTEMVSGKDRPDLPCVMFGGLFGQDIEDAIMMRPYFDEMIDCDFEYNEEFRFNDLIQDVEKKIPGALGILANEYMAVGNKCFGEKQEEYYKLAIENAEKAIATEDLYGYWTLALAYEHGRGVMPDMEKAVEYYNQGAMLGEHNCQNSLAVFYMKGDWLDRDREKAFNLFKKSAMQGNKYAEFSLCKCYEYGHGTEIDLEKAIEWGEKAAIDNSADKMYEVAKLYMYEDEDGKMINSERARYWLGKAADLGHEMAYEMLYFYPIWDTEDNNITESQDSDDELQYYIDTYKDELVAEMISAQTSITKYENDIATITEKINKTEMEYEQFYNEAEENKKESLNKYKKEELEYKQEIDEYNSSFEENKKIRDELLNESEELKSKAKSCSIFKRSLKKELLTSASKIDAKIELVEDELTKINLLIESANDKFYQINRRYSNECESYDKKIAEYKKTINSMNEEINNIPIKISTLTEKYEYKKELWYRAKEDICKDSSNSLNKMLKMQLYDALSEMSEQVTISEFQERSPYEVATLSNQKISALLSELIKEELVEKTILKKKSYFKIIPRPDYNKIIFDYLLLVFKSTSKPMTISELLDYNKLVSMISHNTLDRIIGLLVNENKIIQSIDGNEFVYTISENA